MPGITAIFLWRQLHEEYEVLDLTDGGHFENLGLYELVRRKLKTIVVCDASADRRGEYASLATAIERVRVDFQATIEFPDQDYGLDRLKAGESSGEKVDFATQGADCGFAIGRIIYHDDDDDGTLIYIKPTLTKNLGPEIVSYSRRRPRFPHETTSDQFFDEQQFEVYRELGVVLGDMAAPQISRGKWNQSRWDPPGKMEWELEEAAASDG